METGPGFGVIGTYGFLMAAGQATLHCVIFFWHMGVGGVRAGLFLGWVWLLGRVSIRAAGQWVCRYQDGDGVGGDGSGFSRFDVSGFAMTVVRACGRVCAWVGSGSWVDSWLNALGGGTLARLLMVRRAEKGLVFYRIGV